MLQERIRLGLDRAFLGNYLATHPTPLYLMEVYDDPLEHSWVRRLTEIGFIIPGEKGMDGFKQIKDAAPAGAIGYRLCQATVQGAVNYPTTGSYSLSPFQNSDAPPGLYFVTYVFGQNHGPAPLIVRLSGRAAEESRPVTEGTRPVKEEIRPVDKISVDLWITSRDAERASVEFVKGELSVSVYASDQRIKEGNVQPLMDSAMTLFNRVLSKI